MVILARARATSRLWGSPVGCAGLLCPQSNPDSVWLRLADTWRTLQSACHTDYLRQRVEHPLLAERIDVQRHGVFAPGLRAAHAGEGFAGSAEIPRHLPSSRSSRRRGFRACLLPRRAKRHRSRSYASKRPGLGHGLPSMRPSGVSVRPLGIAFVHLKRWGARPPAAINCAE